MIKFPKHKAGLTLQHNEHLGYYSTVEREIADRADWYGDDSWVSPEEKRRAIDTNELWTLQWYPETPVGFCKLHASTLEALMAAVQDLG